MHRIARTVTAFFPLLIAACAGAPGANPPARCPSASETPKMATQAPVTAPAREKPEMQIDIVPALQEGGINATLTVSATLAGKAKSFSVQTADASAVKLREVVDARGPLKMREELGAERIGYTPERAPQGEVKIQYAVQSRIEEGKLPWLVSDPDRLEIMGDALLLPDIDEKERVTTALNVDLSPYGATGDAGTFVNGAATSYGIGASRQMTTSTREIRGAVIVAGRMGTAVFDALEGHDEAAWFGYTAFDPRPVAADTAAFRTAAAEVFGERSSIPQTLLIVPVPGVTEAFVAARRTQSVLLHVAVQDPWSGPLRIATAVETLHAWIGERLWVGPEEPARALEGAWFADGFARHFARDMLFRFGLVTPLENASEVNSLESVLAMSPFANESNAALAARAREPGVVQTIVARGALYALQMDAAIRQKSGQKRSLTDVVRALYGQAKEKRGPLPTSAWIEAMKNELGPSGAETFAAIIEKGGNLDLPAKALGPCFRKETRKFAKYDLGFDEFGTRAGKPQKVVGVRKEGPAYRAGLRDGDEVINIKRSVGRSDVPAIITIARGENTKTITFAPAGASVTGRGWIRVKDVPDEKCTK